MTLEFQKFILRPFYGAGRRRGLFFCLSLSLAITSQAFALDRRSSSALSHYIVAGVYDGLGEIDKAIQEYKEALKADNENSLIHLNLAGSLIKKNEIPQAIEELKIASSLQPQALEPHAILALLYSSQNKPDLAAAEYEIALKGASELNPQNIDIYKSLGVVYLEQKKFKEARDTYELILGLSPADEQAHFYLANIYSELKNNASAEGELKAALELKPDYHQALNFLGYLYAEENKNLGQAQLLIEKAIKLDPDNGAYTDSLGWLYFKQGKFREAVEQLEKAVSLLEDPVIYDHLGDAYFKINDITNAKLNWEKSLKVKPAQESVERKIEGLKN